MVSREFLGGGVVLSRDLSERLSTPGVFHLVNLKMAEA